MATATPQRPNVRTPTRVASCASNLPFSSQDALTVPPPLPGAPPGSRYRQLMATRHAQISADARISTEYYLTECIVVKRGGPSLREHIIRNSLAGVDAFFVYDDNEPVAEGGEDLESLLAPFGEAVTLRRSVPRRVTAAPVTDHRQVQRRSFYDCVMTHGHRSRWMTFLDSDEYFEAATPTDWAPNATMFAATPFLRPSLRRLEGATPLVPVRWSTALTNGRLVPPPAGSGHTLASYHPTTCAVNGNPRELADWKRYERVGMELEYRNAAKRRTALHRIIELTEILTTSCSLFSPSLAYRVDAPLCMGFRHTASSNRLLWTCAPAAQTTSPFFCTAPEMSVSRPTHLPSPERSYVHLSYLPGTVSPPSTSRPCAPPPEAPTIWWSITGRETCCPMHAR